LEHPPVGICAYVALDLGEKPIYSKLLSERNLFDMTKVLSARFYSAKEPVILEETDLPSIGADDVLIDVKATGICHSDLWVIEGKFAGDVSPMTLGHEISGV